MSSPGQSEHQQGIALSEQGDFTGALAAFDAALARAPDAAAIHYSRANALVMLNRLEPAVAAYDACLSRDPGHVSAHYNRATAMARLQRWPEALAGLDRALAQNPAMAEAWNNRSGVLQAMGRHPEALESALRVLRLRPQDAAAYYNAGITLLLLNRFDEAVQFLERCLQLNPRHADAFGSLGSAVLRSCDWDRLERLVPALFAAVGEGAVVLAPLALLGICDDPLLQRRCSETNTRRSLGDAAGTGGDVVPDDAPLPHDRIRLGYLSSDFRDHPVGIQIAGLMESHDRARFEVIGLSTGGDDGSAARRRIEKACDRFHDLTLLGSRQAADLIRTLGVDIVIDLNGQTQGWRPAILSHRPAPVIATYLGYAGTTGSDFVDYIIGDPHVAPFELAPAMSEKIVQLPDCFWPADPHPVEPAPFTRAEAGLPDDAFVFCCFNSNHKIRPGLFDSWMRILQAVPKSVLWLRDASPAINERFRHEARRRGVEDSRLIFAGRIDGFARHLGRQRLADLFLDTFPYNAHVTAMDALAAGLPLLTLQGESFVSRVAASFLANLDLPELIATTLADYEAAAIALAENPERLAQLRRRLADARSASALFDAKGFARNIEAAFQTMQDRARRGEAPASFRVGAPVLSGDLKDVT